jgi:branched-chain amino acid transport system ATP-binding protein
VDALLCVQDVGISFGDNHVLKSLNFELQKGEVLGVIGPNGAGKTVALNILTGILPPSKGKVVFEGEDITHLPITKRCRKGIGRTFQVPRPFENMTVLENIMVGSAFGNNKTQNESTDIAVEIAEIIGLGDKLFWFAGKLGLLDRKRLEIGRAMATNPKLLLFHEVAGGLTESEVGLIIELVKTVKEKGIGVVWIEHVLKTMREGTDRVLLMAEGRDVIVGKPEEVMTSKEVRDVYLGADEK